MKKTLGLILSLSPIITLAILLIVSPDHIKYSSIPLLLITPIGIHLLRSTTSTKTNILSTLLPSILIIISNITIPLLPTIRYTFSIINLICLLWITLFLPYSIYLFFKKTTTTKPESSSPNTSSLFQKIITNKITYVILLIIIIAALESYSHEYACGYACSAPFFGLKSWITGWIYPYISFEDQTLGWCGCSTVLRAPIELTIPSLPITIYLIYKIFNKKIPSNTKQ